MASRAVEVSARANSRWKEVECWPSLAGPMFDPAVVMAPLVPSILTQTAVWAPALAIKFLRLLSNETALERSRAFRIMETGTTGSATGELYGSRVVVEQSILREWSLVVPLPPL